MGSTLRFNRTTAGIVLAVISSVSFGAGGPFAKALIEGGFSPLQAVWIRLIGTVAVLTVLCLVLPRPGRLATMRAHRWPIVVYGLITVASCQGLYFVAASRLPVGVAILLEFTGPVVVVAWTKLVQRRHVPRVSVTGVAVAMLGLACVVQIWSGVQLDALGILAGLGAAVGNAVYFLLIDKLGDDIDPLTLTTGGMVVGLVALTPLAAPWAAPWHVLGDSVRLGGGHVPGWFLAAFIILVSTVLAYLTGAAAIQRLSAPIAAGLAYVEPASATVFAWVALGEHLTTPQILGGIIVLAGAFLAQRGIAAAGGAEHLPAPTAEPAPQRGTGPVAEPLIP